MTQHSLDVVARWAALLGFLATSVFATGCGPQTYPVSLVFTLEDETLLTAGSVIVRHTVDPAIRGGGPIAPDGTCRPMLRGRPAPGLPAGTYQLGISGPAPAAFQDPSEVVWPFDRSYADPKISGLTLTVGPGHPDKATFTLSNRKTKDSRKKSSRK